jgi:acetolactate synthase-1/3 small subunit
MKKTISIIAFNDSGVLTRIVTVFSSRGFAMDSIAIGETETEGICRITIVLPGNDQVLDQVIKQLSKLVQILHIKDVTNVPRVERELVLIEIEASQKIRTEIIEMAQVFRTKIVDISDKTIMMEVTGDPGKIAVIEKLLEKYRVINIARTGKILLERNFGIDTEHLKAK